MNRKFICIILLAFALVSAMAQDNSSLLKTGAEAPAFTLDDIGGKKVSLGDFRGRYVLIDFWASWCPDCRKDNPRMVNLFKKYGDKVSFLGVSFDDNVDNWKKAVAKDSLAWTHVSELKKWKETTISKNYGIKWIPTVYLIDPEGRVAYADIDGRGLEKKLAELFGK